jgi:hypothetical protein
MIRDFVGVSIEDQHLFIRDSVTGLVDHQKKLGTSTLISRTGIVNGSLLRYFLGKVIDLTLRDMRSGHDFTDYRVRFFDLETVMDLKILLCQSVKMPLQLELLPESIGLRLMIIGTPDLADSSTLRDLRVVSNAIIDIVKFG